MFASKKTCTYCNLVNFGLFRRKQCVQTCLYVVRHVCMLSDMSVCRKTYRHVLRHVCLKTCLYVVRHVCMLSDMSVCRQTCLYVVRHVCMSSDMSVCRQKCLYVVRHVCMSSDMSVCRHLHLICFHYILVLKLNNKTGKRGWK